MAKVTITLSDEGDSLRMSLASEPPLPVGHEEDSTFAQRCAAACLMWLTELIEPPTSEEGS